MQFKETRGGYEVFEDDNTVIRAWQDDEMWNIRVLRYNSIHGFARNRDKEQALKDALELCDNKCRFVYRMLRQRYEVF